MEAMLLSLTLAVVFCALVGCYRANRLLAALPADPDAVLSGPVAAWSGKAAALMMSAGKYLIFGGGIAVLPLFAGLFFAPEAGASPWVAPAGFYGCLALAAAGVLLAATGVINGLTHSFRVKHLVAVVARFVLAKALSLARLKVFWASLAVIIIATAFPALWTWIMEALTFLDYALMFFIAGQLGLLDYVNLASEQKEEESLLQQATNYDYGNNINYHGTVPWVKLGDKIWR